MHIKNVPLHSHNLSPLHIFKKRYYFMNHVFELFSFIIIWSRITDGAMVMVYLWGVFGVVALVFSFLSWNRLNDADVRLGAPPITFENCTGGAPTTCTSEQAGHTLYCMYSEDVYWCNSATMQYQLVGNLRPPTSVMPTMSPVFDSIVVGPCSPLPDSEECFQGQYFFLQHYQFRVSLRRKSVVMV